MSEPTPTDPPQYYVLVTQAGLALEAASHASGQPLRLASIAVGDGLTSGTAPSASAYFDEYHPDGSETALRGERWRGPLTKLAPHPSTPSWWQAEIALPDEVGGWYITEVGLYTEDGTLYAIAKYPPSLKPQWSQGSGRQMYITLIFQMSHSSAATIVIDPNVINATRQYVDSSIANTTLTAQTTGAAGHIPVRSSTPPDPTDPAAARHPVQWAPPGALLGQALAQQSNFAAALGARYYLANNLDVTLPDAQGCSAGAAIAFIKAQAATPTITAADGQRIVLANGQSDSRILFDINAEIILTWNGTNWEV